MLVCLITHPGDRNLTVPLCEHIRTLGGAFNHDCVIISPNGTDMVGIEDVLRGAFRNVETHQYAASMKGWPWGANEAAAVAMMHIWQKGWGYYLMLEPDCIPTRKFWLDHLETEYQRCGTPMLGVRINTVKMDTNRIVGRHTVGVAIYPGDFPKRCPLVRSLIPMSVNMRAINGPKMPWDAYFGAYTAKMTTDTSLIQHLSRVRTDGPNGWTWDCVSLADALQQARPEAALIHGSKDPEFLEQITGRIAHAKITEEPKPQPVTQRQAPASHAAPQQATKSPGKVQHRLGIEPQPPPEGLSKVQQRQWREADAIRVEWEIIWPLHTPEWERCVYFHTKCKWTEIKSYAAKNLQINSHGKTKGKLVCAIVEKEKEQMKEPWTAVFRPIEEQPLPTEPVGRSQAANTTQLWNQITIKDGKAVDGPSQTSGNELSPEQRQKMIQLRLARGLPVGT